MERRKNLNDKFGFVGKIMRKKTTIKDIACFSKGSQINGDLLLDEGKYEYLNGGTKASGTWNEFNVNGKTITISEGGNSCGYVNFMKEKFWCGAHCYYLFDVKCKPKYLYYLLKGNQSNLMKLRFGACMPNIKKSDLGNFKFIYDSDVIHQDKIISIFDNLTNVIYFYEKQIKYFDNLVKARFIEMFGDPENNPNGWMESPLSEKLSVLGGFAFKSDKFSEISGIPILRIGNINSGHFKPVNMVYWKEDENLERYLIYPGDLVMSLTGTVGKDDYGNVCILGDDFEKYYLNQRNAKLEIQGGINKFYLSQLLKFTQVKKKLTGISRGVRQANISNKDILNLVVPIPPIELQQQFEDFVHQVDKSRFDIKKSIIELEREVVYD